MGWLANFLLPGLACGSALTTNYASADCSARVVDCSRGGENARHVLADSNCDSYARFPSSLREKWLVVQLCENIQLDEVLVANHELFSDTPASVSLSVASKRAQLQWTDLGTFPLSAHGPTSIPIVHRSGFVRFIRLEFWPRAPRPRHYYTTVSWIRVLGRTMMEDLLQSSGGDSDRMVVYAPMDCDPQREQQNVYKALFDRLASLEAESKFMFQTLLTQMNQRLSPLFADAVHRCNEELPLATYIQRQVFKQLVFSHLLATLVVGTLYWMHQRRRIGALAPPAPSAAHTPRSLSPSRLAVLDDEEPVDLWGLHSPNAVAAARSTTRKQQI